MMMIIILYFDYGSHMNKKTSYNFRQRELKAIGIWRLGYSQHQNGVGFPESRVLTLFHQVFISRHDIIIAISKALTCH